MSNLKSFLFGFLIFISSHTLSEILFVTDQLNENTEKILSSFSSKFDDINTNKSNNQFSISVVTLDDLQQAGSLSKYLNKNKTIITLGIRSAEYLSELNIEKRIISALITRSELDVSKIKPIPSGQHYILVLDQPLENYLDLAKLLFPKAKNIGVLAGPTYWSEIDKNLDFYSKKNIQFARISMQSNPIKVIEPVMEKSDFFIVLPNQEEVNRSSATWVLQLSYRYQKGVIGFSKNYTSAGALASIFTSPKNISDDIYRLITKKLIGENFVLSPNEMSVEINKSVARFLNIDVKNPDYYVDLLRRSNGIKRDVEP